MRAIVIFAAAAVALPAFAQSQPPSAPPSQGKAQLPSETQTAQGEVAVTIYNNDLGLVQDRRTIALPAGRTRQEFPDVSAQIRAETVSVAADGIEIVEQNFDYDLLSPQALMTAAVGETITLVRTNPGTGAELRERARVLAVNGGVVLQIGERIEVLRDDGLPVRVIFDRVPANLRARPTLSVTMESARAGARPVTLSYLTPGLGWRADYVTLFDEAAGRIDVQGWITLSNTTGTTFSNANTMLVAGAVGQGQDANRRRGYPDDEDPAALRRAGTETSARERLGDFYLYPLAERTTIANRQTKQVSFLDVSGAPAERGYEFRNGWLGTAEQARSASTVLRFSSSRDQGLGDALPAGIVRVYQRDARGNPQFVGESRIGHTPMGSSLGLVTGEAFDVKVHPVVEKRERLTGGRYRTTMRYTLTNARPAPVTVDLVQSGLSGDTRIAEESQRSERRSAEEAVWRVAVPANGEQVVTVTFDTRY
ncbi:MAG TPA: DUF4139 domain-containing protein [Allosphingosinicella sp.]|jgi:hypothetical protein|nr:DUF4139 domain-containing protein [Allosphingosinicella sp.]